MHISTPPDGDNPHLELALYLADQGLPVHPRKSNNKGPVTRHGHLDSTTDEAEIIAWWIRWPTALFAIPTGFLTGLPVLDLDGPNGRRWLEEFLAHLRCSVADLTPYLVETPRNGLHLYFPLRPGERIASRAGDIAEDVDVRGDGGCIIAAGNRLPDGGR